MATKNIADINVAGKKVLMRVDFNVPIKGGKVTNDRRIVQALPSIKRALEQGAKLILMSHLGRPAGKGYEEEFSAKPAAVRLGELLGKTVQVGPQSVVGPELDAQVAAMKDGDVLLLENLRFSAGETMPDKAKKNEDKKLTAEQQKVHDDFVEAIAKNGEAYVNDAFGTCHRKHASMYGVAKAIQAKGGPAVAGFLVEKEIKYLSEALNEPKRPFVAVLGGAKVSDKIKLISQLLPKVDRIIIGGAMAYTLLKAKGVEVGKSRVEEDQVEEMKGLLEKAGDKILLPCDHLAVANFDFKALTGDAPTVTPGTDIPAGMMGMDIGPKSVEAFCKEVKGAKTVVWNGPMGVFEAPDFANGTKSVATALAIATDGGAISVIGGGDSATAVEEMGLDTRMTHVSTGGGASLEYLEGKPMPPIEVLDTK
ncbi:TPA: phosphoglycerate kinase [Candidatus Sumerlaeota bacterium]|jgi:phosphoglycerate kinase|nr:phosphoglycerate kinase [Candidatus Sumerlaeota bacterium]